MSDCGVVQFNYSIWAAVYPELSASVSQPQAQGYFDQAQFLYCDNSPQSPIRDLGQRAILLGLVTAHIAALRAPLNGQPSSPLVGRISQGTQGSVSVSTQMDMAPGTAQWWNQSKYGAQFWAATTQFRSMRYIPGPQPFRNGAGPFRNPWGL